MLTLGRHTFADDVPLIMAIVNRTPDLFYDRGETFAFDIALQRVRDVVRDGAEIVDIGGVKAAPGDVVNAAEEIERTVSFVAAVRADFPDLIISVDTWRHEVGAAVWRSALTSSTTPGAVGIPSWPRWRHISGPGSSARMPAGPNRAPAHTVSPTTTSWPLRRWGP